MKKTIPILFTVNDVENIQIRTIKEIDHQIFTITKSELN